MLDYIRAHSYVIVEGCRETATSIASYAVAKEHLDLAESSLSDSATSQSVDHSW